MTIEDIKSIAKQKGTSVCVAFKHYKDYRKVFGSFCVEKNDSTTEWYIYVKKISDNFVSGHCSNNCKKCLYTFKNEVCVNFDPNTYRIEYENLIRERKLKRILK